MGCAARADARARRGRRRCRSAVACRVHPVAALPGAGGDRVCGPCGRGGSGGARAPPPPPTWGAGMRDPALRGPEEPAEVGASWRTTYGRTLPDGLRRGVADAAVRLYTERSAMKWDGTDRAWRMGGGLAVTHPTPKDPRQAALFRYLIDRRYGRAEGDYGLPAVHRRQWLDAMVPAARRSWLASDPESAGRELQQAGHDWRSLATWLQGPLDATAWEAILPGLGYMAILRNLRNLDEAGLSNETAEAVARKLMDPAEVRVSRQFPLRFISAAREVRSLR